MKAARLDALVGAESFEVGLTEDVAAAMRMHARAAGISPEQWIAMVAAKEIAALADLALDEGWNLDNKMPAKGSGRN